MKSVDFLILGFAFWVASFLIQLHLLYELELFGQLGLIISLVLHTFRLSLGLLLLLVLMLILLILSAVLILWLTVLHVLYHLLLIENRVNMVHLIKLLHLVVILLHPMIEKN